MNPAGHKHRLTPLFPVVKGPVQAPIQGQFSGPDRPEQTPAEALYAIDSLKNHIRGKMRKSEFWLSELIDKVVEGRKAGLSEEALKPALEQHQKAHIYWEWWTAENSDGFHNPDAARESLTRSVEESKKGIKAVDEALAARKAAPAP